MPEFKIVSEYQPQGDQPRAIGELTEGILRGDLHQTLLGVTGSGATRSFLFAADYPVGEGGGRDFDVFVYSGSGNLAPGTRSATISDGEGAVASYGPEKFVDFAAPD